MPEKEDPSVISEEPPSSIEPKQWNNWKWQIQNSITTKKQLEKYTKLLPEEEEIFNNSSKLLPFRITPYYLGTILNSPLRKTMIPTIHETIVSEHEKEDPLNEDEMMPCPGIVHRYPDRVLFLVSNVCAAYCRYCTRSRIFHQCRSTKDYYETAIEYIKSNPSIRDVLLSGGDSLMLDNNKLEWILKEIKQIKHVEFIRMGTKIPAVLPQRINKKLVNMLKKYHPLWMSLHFTHPDEITTQTKNACNLLADAGIPLGSQTVLLKGVNDNVETMKKLFHELLKIKVRPYYLYMMDLILGSRHFRTTVQSGIDIIEGLRGHTTGYAVPQLIIDGPGGKGKIPILPNYIISNNDEKIVIRNYKNEKCEYYN